MRIVENTPLRLRFVDTASHHLALYLALFGIVPSIVVGIVNLAPHGNPDALRDVIRGLAVVWGAIAVLYGVIRVLSISGRSATFDRSKGQLWITDWSGRLIRTVSLDDIDEPYRQSDLRPGGLFYRFVVRLRNGENVLLSKRWNKDKKRFDEGEKAILGFLGRPIPYPRPARDRERKRCHFCTWIETRNSAVVVDLTNPDGRQDVMIIPRCWRCETLHGGLFVLIGLLSGMALTVAAGMSMYRTMELIVLILVLPFLFFGSCVGLAFLMEWLFKPSRFGLAEESSCLEDPEIGDLLKEGWTATIRKWDISSS